MRYVRSPAGGLRNLFRATAALKRNNDVASCHQPHSAHPTRPCLLTHDRAPARATIDSPSLVRGAAAEAGCVPDKRFYRQSRDKVQPRHWHPKQASPLAATIHDPLLAGIQYGHPKPGEDEAHSIGAFNRVADRDQIRRVALMFRLNDSLRKPGRRRPRPPAGGSSYIAVLSPQSSVASSA